MNRHCTIRRKRALRQGHSDRRFQRSGKQGSVRAEVVGLHAFTHARRDVRAHGLYTGGRTLDAQRQVQCRLQIAGHRLRVAVPARRRHAFAHAFQNVCADLAGIQFLQEGQDGLQIVEVFLLDFLPLLDRRHDLAHIGG